MTAAEVADWVTRSTHAKHWVAIVSTESFDLRAEIGHEVPDVSVATRDGSRCLVQGLLYGVPNVGPASESSGLAEQLLQAYERFGDRVLDHLGGFFSFVIVDERKREVLAVRDPLGVHPLFYSRRSGELLLSSSISSLTARPEVSAAVNRAALADHLRYMRPRPEETFLEAVARVPSAHALHVTSTSTTSWRYWDPLCPGRSPVWIDEADLGQFEVLLDDAVLRLQKLGPAGIFLSGGLDSVTVAALAVDLARRDGLDSPLALSVVFPEPHSEHVIQTGVADQLGLRQRFVDLDDALGDGGLVRAAMRSAWLSAPIQNPWLSAYRELARQARDDGCQVILTGSGGDEWLGVTPLYAADLLRSLQFGELIRLATAQRRSYDVATWPFARNMAWRFGLRPLLARERNRIMGRVAPARLTAHRVEARRMALQRRSWLAPDQQLRRELRDRDEEYAIRLADEEDQLPAGGPREYFRENRKLLTDPLISMELEEVFEYSRDVGVRVVHPFWDTRLVEFLFATPPRLLNRGGRAKGLVRSMLARRFPTLGFERQRKTISVSYFRSSVLEQASSAWQEIGGAQALGDAGIVDPTIAAALYDSRSGSAASNGSPRPAQIEPMWEILILESWLRAHR